MYIARRKSTSVFFFCKVKNLVPLAIADSHLETNYFSFSTKAFRSAPMFRNRRSANLCGKRAACGMKAGNTCTHLKEAFFFSCFISPGTVLIQILWIKITLSMTFLYAQNSKTNSNRYYKYFMLKNVTFLSPTYVDTIARTCIEVLVPIHDLLIVLPARRTNCYRYWTKSFFFL